MQCVYEDGGVKTGWCRTNMGRDSGLACVLIVCVCVCVCVYVCVCVCVCNLRCGYR